MKIAFIVQRYGTEILGGTDNLDLLPRFGANTGGRHVAIGPLAGDTAAAVRAYAKRMHLEPQFRYLIGTRSELRPVWAGWHVLSVQRKAGLVDHIAYTMLIDRAGKERVLYDSQVRARQVVHDLRRMMRPA